MKISRQRSNSKQSGGCYIKIILALVELTADTDAVNHMQFYSENLSRIQKSGIYFHVGPSERWIEYGPSGFVGTDIRATVYR